MLWCFFPCESWRGLVSYHRSSTGTSSLPVASSELSCDCGSDASAIWNCAGRSSQPAAPPSLFCARYPCEQLKRVALLPAH
eukprot:2040368-Pleurochrysis_carterae.AAC.2